MNAGDEVAGHYETELLKYKSKILPLLNESIISEREPYNLPLDGLLNFYLLSLYLLDNQDQYFTSPPKYSLNLFFTKTSTDIISLHQCLSIGQLISSNYIIRSIFETFVTLKLISEKDSDFRMKLYENSRIVTRWNHYNNYKKYIEELEKDGNVDQLNSVQNDFRSVFAKGQIEELEKKFKAISNDYNPNKPYHWAWAIYKDELKEKKNPSLSFICKKLGLYHDYLQIYSSTSLAMHSDPLTINLIIKEGYPTPSPNFSSKVKNDAALCLHYTTEIFLIIFKLISSPKYSELEFFINYYFHKYIK